MITLQRFNNILDEAVIDSVTIKDITVEGKTYPAIINEPESRVTLLELSGKDYEPSIMIYICNGELITTPCKVETF